NIDAQVGFNYGIAFISAVLKQHGHITRLLNINEKLAAIPTDEQIKQFVKDYNPALIGFSVVTPQYQHALRFARAIKSFSNIPIVCGGIHATMVPEEALRKECFDYVCVGEGEEAILELVTKLENGEDTSRIPNIWTKRACSEPFACHSERSEESRLIAQGKLRESNEKIIKNNVRPLTDISRLPRKDYELFDLQRLIDVEDGWVRLMASRGCPYRCTYCFNHKIVERYKEETSSHKLNYLRRHSVDEVLSEIDFLLSRYRNIRMFIFDDDLFTQDKKYLSEFCDKYPKHTTLPFVVNAHVKAFDEERAQALKQANCAIVKFGLESGSERIRREILNRPMSNDEIIRAFQYAQKYDLHTSAFVMFGLPHETKEDIIETIKLLSVIKPGRFRWSIFFPFPGTVAYEISAKGGYLNLEKMKRLNNFTDDTCLDFEPAHNLFISKLQKTFPWYVNMYLATMTTPHSPPCEGGEKGEVIESNGIYSSLVRLVEQQTAESWDKFKDCIPSLDRELSRCLSLAFKEHYRIKYNSFTAVRSDWSQ
ncbi:MAG TPA: radical SAM protein, partial [Candidatus Brocadiales bacterium]|nr:radical SAM protein [Candidatus Brocadiales bacterium]